MNSFFGFQGGSPKSNEPQQEKTGLTELFGSLKKAADQIADEVKTQVNTIQKEHMQNENVSSQPEQKMQIYDMTLGEPPALNYYLSYGQTYLRNGFLDKALDVFHKGVRLGDVNCALELYNMYSQGDGVECNYARAYFWARMASHLGSAEGTYIAGIYHRDGIAVPEASDLEAYKYLEKAARCGHQGAREAVQEIERKTVFFYSNDEQLTYEQMKERADHASTEEECSRYLLLMAMISDDILAKNWIGIRFLEGVGVNTNYIAAMYWFKKGIEKGNMYAAYNLAKMYETGTGVLIDYEEARRLYTIAAKQGHSTAQERTVYIESILNMTADQLCYKGDDFERNIYNLVVKHHFYLLASAKGHANATTRAANDYRWGSGVKRDYMESLIYYGKAVMMQDKEAAGYAYRIISSMFALGQGVKANTDIANYYYVKARELGNQDALQHPTIQAYMENNKQRAMQSPKTEANMYQEGNYCMVNMNRAVDLYEIGGKNGTSICYLHLAGIYAYGFCTKRNPHLMIEYLKKARDCGWGYEKEEPNTAKGILLSYYNLTNFMRYEEFTDKVALDAAEIAFKERIPKLAYAYLDIAKELGADIEPLIRKFDPNHVIRPDKTQQSAPIQIQEKVRLNRPTMVRKNAVIVKWLPEDITDEQVEEIRQLVREDQLDELYSLGISYCSGDGRERNGRLAAMCFKLAAERRYVVAALAYAWLSVLSDGGAIPSNLPLCKRILDRFEGIEWKGNEEINEMIQNFHKEIKEFYAERMEQEQGLTQEDIELDIKKFSDAVAGMEEKHYQEEEWFLYQFYWVIANKKNQNKDAEAIGTLPYESTKSEWDSILEKDWERYYRHDHFMYIESFEMFGAVEETEEKEEFEEFEEPEVEVTHLSTGENERPETLPDNLDSYFGDMIGMEPVKAQLNKIYRTVKIQLLRDEVLRERGIEPQENEKSYNFILLGNPGTGKTTVARIIAKILYDIKIRATDSFVEVERSGVVSDHVGGTENRMREILEKVKGGTLFIDEAYSLYKEDAEHNFGQEAIDVLMKDMEDNRDSYSVIMAGYKEPMLNMIRHANTGFSSRFSYIIELPDYSDEALVEIAHMHMDKQNLIAGEGVDEAIVKCIHHDKLDQTFGNARYIRELVYRAVENQALRLNEMTSFEKDDLFQLKPEDFWQGTMEEEGVEKYLKELNNLTGLASVKKDVESLIRSITVQQEMEKRGLNILDNLGTLHMAFKGNPGTGKTTVARIIGKLYASLGVLKRGDVFVECTRADLVGKYQGHTADKVKKVIESALGGILFIDEAYSLVQGEGDSFGNEAVDALVSEMENKRQNLVIIFAGYTKDIDEFFKNNQGLRSRVPKDLFFEDYNMEEMFSIALSMLKGKKLNLTEEAKQEIRARISLECMQPDFGNARGVRNIVESIWRNQNVRIANLLKEKGGEVTDEMILQVEKEDVLK